LNSNIIIPFIVVVLVITLYIIFCL